jgi:hypothetical protein
MELKKALNEIQHLKEKLAQEEEVTPDFLSYPPSINTALISLCLFLCLFVFVYVSLPQRHHHQGSLRNGSLGPIHRPEKYIKHNNQGLGPIRVAQNRNSDAVIISTKKSVHGKYEANLGQFEDKGDGSVADLVVQRASELRDEGSTLAEIKVIINIEYPRWGTTKTKRNVYGIGLIAKRNHNGHYEVRANIAVGAAIRGGTTTNNIGTYADSGPADSVVQRASVLREENK